MRESTTRAEIVAAADRLFYRQGYAQTSFSDIAGAVKIARGNFYYHFKTKDEILDAVIAARLAATRTMLAQWEEAGDGPAARIQSFIRLMLVNRGDIRRYGCPVGTLCGELAKLNHAASEDARALFGLFRVWLRRQFQALGCDDADGLAQHLLGRSQGIATLAQAFADEKFIRREVGLLEDWLQSCIAAADQPRRRKSA